MPLPSAVPFPAAATDAPRRGAILPNVVLYQATWFAAVLGAAAQHPAAGVAAAAGSVLYHLHAARAPRRELALIGIATLAGVLFESLLLATGWISMAPATLIGGVLPPWMVALWASLATTFNVSLRALRPRTLTCALLALFGAPLAYAAGARLGALHWVDAPRGLLLVAVGWAVLLPLLMKAAQRYDGFAAA